MRRNSILNKVIFSLVLAPEKGEARHIHMSKRPGRGSNDVITGTGGSSTSNFRCCGSFPESQMVDSQIPFVLLRLRFKIRQLLVPS